MEYGLIGERLGHSFSEKIHSLLGDYSYKLKELPRETLASFLKERDFKGINVTIPYKEEVIPYLDCVSEEALAVGAVNTVVNRGGRLFGYNTDVAGLEALILNSGILVKGRKVAVLGGGGTAKTALYVMKRLGAGEILKVSRQKRDGFIDYEALGRRTDLEVIVNTTPVGMYGSASGMAVDPELFPRLSGVIDVVYNPPRSALVLKAASLGINAVGGLYMLVSQAVAASELFLDRSYPEGITEAVYGKIKRETENIVLIGMPSSGKSTVGELLSKELGRKLVDTDCLVEENTGRKIKDIFAEDGEELFRTLEKEAVRLASGLRGAIIATGGGAILKEESRNALRSAGRIYFLDRPIEKLAVGGERPLAQSTDAIKRLYSERLPIYEELCDLKISGDMTPRETLEKILGDFFK